MLNFRKIGLTAIALGVITGPALAQTGLSVNTATGLGTGSVTTDLNVDAQSDLNRANEQTNRTLTQENRTDLNAGVDTDLNSATDLSFGTYDQDADGMVTEEEFSSNADANISTDTFSSYDMNEDGMLDETEFDKMSRSEVETETEIQTNYTN